MEYYISGTRHNYFENRLRGVSDNYSDEYEDRPDCNKNDFCDVEDLDDSNEKVEFISLEIPDKIMQKYNFIKELPDGVCVMGGLARSIAREVFTGEFEPIRDIDLVVIEGFSDEELTSEVIDKCSMEYMPDDYSYGHGIATETLDDYFNTRDFTVNQALVYNKELLVSEQAIDDFKENIIRPTSYERSKNDQRLGDKLAVKALLMKVVLGEVSESVPTLEDFNVDFFNLQPFFVALGMNKALDRGKETARNFTNLLVEHEVLDVSFYDKPLEAARSLRAETDFLFRPSGAESIAIKGLSRSLFNRSTADIDYYSNNRAVESAMDDYVDFDKYGNTYDDLYSSDDYLKVNKVI